MLAQQRLHLGAIEKDRTARIPQRLPIEADGGIEGCGRHVAGVDAAGMEVRVPRTRERDLRPARHVVPPVAGMERGGIDAAVPGVDRHRIAAEALSDPQVVFPHGARESLRPVKSDDTTPVDLQADRLVEQQHAALVVVDARRHQETLEHQPSGEIHAAQRRDR